MSSLLKRAFKSKIVLFLFSTLTILLLSAHYSMGFIMFSSNAQLVEIREPLKPAQLDSGETVAEIKTNPSLQVYQLTAQVPTADLLLTNSNAAVLGSSTTSTYNASTKIFGPKGIYIEVMGYTVRSFTYMETVEEILTQMQLKPDEDDMILPGIHTRLVNDLKVKFIKVDEEIEEQRTDIPFTTQYIKDPAVLYGETKVTTPGVLGAVVHTKKTVFHNGVIFNTVDLGQKRIEPVTEVISQGTKLDKKTIVMEDGTEFTYCAVINMKVTAYDPSCQGCNNITALGYELKKGIVAVDPKVIPFRSYVYVPGYGLGFAADTGGAVKGNIIDVGFESREQRLSQWRGTKRDNVYLACPNM